MAKKQAFEDLLETDFRWPTAGDNPFVRSENWFDNAIMPKEKNHRMANMTRGYKQAADLMVSSTTENRFERDAIVFPIIFNYRQYIELSLKYLISEYGPNVEIDPIWNTHDLARLWSEFSKILERYGTPDPDEADAAVKEIVAEFSKIDQHSFAMRYPVDTRGNPIPLEQTELNLDILADVMKGLESYFDGCDGFLFDQISGHHLSN